MNAEKEKVVSKTLGWHNSQPGNRKYILFSEVGGSTPASTTLLPGNWGCFTSYSRDPVSVKSLQESLSFYLAEPNVMLLH